MLNIESLKHNEQNIDTINLLCKPLMNNFHITHFWYAKFYPDLSFIELTNDMAWKNCIWQNDYFDSGDAVRNIFHSIKTDNNSLTIKTGNVAPELIINAGKYYNIYNNYNIVTKYDNYFEILGFATNKSFNKPDLFYLQHNVYLKLFGDYFKNKAEDLITAAPIVYFKDNVQNNLPKYSYERDIDQFLKDISYDQYTILIKNNLVKLSKREYEVLSHYIYGKTAKEISQSLKLSPRTIEAYMINIKNKARIYNKSELVSAFMRSNLMPQIIV